MTRKGYSTIIVLDSVRKKLDRVKKRQGLKSYNQTLMYLTNMELV